MPKPRTGQAPHWPITREEFHERFRQKFYDPAFEKEKEAIARIEREGHRAVVVEAALIHESGRKGLFEAVISVTCDRETAISRLAARDGMKLRAPLDGEDLQHAVTKLEVLERVAACGGIVG